MKITIVGDSFSADENPNSWVTLLSNSYHVKNFSQRGISQYRIFQIVKNNCQTLFESDVIILFHTNPDRIFVPDHVNYPTRNLTSHPCADMVASDILSRPQWEIIAQNYYKYFFDFEFQNNLFKFIFKDIAELLSQKKVLHCTGHKLTSFPEIKSFNELFLTNPGTINHFDITGNQVVFNHITKHLYV